MKQRTFVIVVGSLTIAAVIALLQPLYHYRRTRCVEVLKVLGDSIHLYQVSHDGQLPRTLTVLSNDLITPLLLMCPGSRNHSGTFDNADSWSDYLVVDWAKWNGTNAVPSEYPIAYDRTLHNHSGHGINVLSADGFVRWDPNAEQLNRFVKEHPQFRLVIPE